MKDGWKEGRLGDLCTIERGGSPRPIKSFITTAENGLNWIKIGDTEKDGKYIYKTAEKIIPEGLKKSRWVEKDEFLLSNSMSFGRPYILKTNGCIHDGWLVLRDYQSKLNIDFFYYLLTSPRVQNQFRTKAQGSTVSNLNTDRVASVIVSYPSLSDQQSIVEYLDSSFAKIDAMKANAEKALTEAKALFQASLNHLLEDRVNWEKKTLGDIATDSADGPFGSNLKKEHYTTNKEVRIIQLSNIGEDGWREENTKYTTFEHLKTISRSEVEPGDVVVAKMMPAGRAILCPSHEAKYVLSSDAVKIKLKKGIVTRFILHSINSPYFREEVYENVTGSGRVRTSLTKLRACDIYLPSVAVQQAIVDTLDKVQAKVDQLQANYDKISAECDALKQSLLKQVFE